VNPPEGEFAESEKEWNVKKSSNPFAFRFSGGRKRGKGMLEKIDEGGLDP